MNESELIRRSQAGDREAFAELIRWYGDPIFRLARQVCAQAPAEADGVHQDTFVTALEKIQQFQNRSQLGTWLYRIAANLCLMRLRSKHRSAAVSLDASLQDSDQGPASFQDHLKDPAPDPVAAAKRRELQEAVIHALEALPADYRLVVTLRDIQGLSTEETAVQLQLSEAAVKSRLHRGRLFLREKLLPFHP
ncbi:MAG: sigma-70 family RNA polymerase sigma factor [Elusimicrobiota bacterium]|jgi:RNA polymerase sigma-70 factor (ECF subfamily)